MKSLILGLHQRSVRVTGIA